MPERAGYSQPVPERIGYRPGSSSSGGNGRALTRIFLEASGEFRGERLGSSSISALPGYLNLGQDLGHLEAGPVAYKAYKSIRTQALHSTLGHQPASLELKSGGPHSLYSLYSRTPGSLP